MIDLGPLHPITPLPPLPADPYGLDGMTNDELLAALEIALIEDADPEYYWDGYEG